MASRGPGNKNTDLTIPKKTLGVLKSVSGASSGKDIIMAYGIGRVTIKTGVKNNSRVDAKGDTT